MLCRFGGRDAHSNTVFRSEQKIMSSKSVILSLLVAIGLLASVCFSKYSGGTGEPNNPYLIETPNDLNSIGLNVEDFNKCFLMVADINLVGFTGEQFNIIGPNSTTPFTGVFDGNGHTISNFTYESNDFGFWVGLFGYIDDPCAQVRDLGLVEPCVAGFRNVGAIVGNIERGGVSRCFATGGSVSGTHVTGGVVGANWFGEVVESYSTSNVVGEYEVGGLVGYVECGSVADCYSCGSVSGFQTVGGLLGENNYGIVVNCYARGEVSGETAVGGLIGRREFAVIEHSFWDVNSSGEPNSAGGTGLTTAQMQMRNTFAYAGWDMVNVWDIGENQTYPFLRTHLPSDINKDDGTNFYDLAILAGHWLDEK